MSRVEAVVAFDKVREVSWASTAPFLPLMAEMLGRDVLKAIREGRLAPPPLARVIGFHIVSVGEGEVEFCLEPREDLENLTGVLHGGVAATLLDNALGAAVQTLLPAGARSATLNLNVSYLRALTVKSGLITARGRVTRLTRSAAFVEGTITDREDERYAQAVATFAISYPHLRDAPSAAHFTMLRATPTPLNTRPSPSGCVCAAMIVR